MSVPHAQGFRNLFHFEHVVAAVRRVTVGGDGGSDIGREREVEIDGIAPRSRADAARDRDVAVAEYAIKGVGSSLLQWRKIVDGGILFAVGVVVSDGKGGLRSYCGHDIDNPRLPFPFFLIQRYASGLSVDGLSAERNALGAIGYRHEGRRAVFRQVLQCDVDRSHLVVLLYGDVGVVGLCQ